MIKQGGVLRFFSVLFLILSIICSGFFYSRKLLRAEEVSIIINEIAWMGTETSANDEWIELFNKSSAEVILDGWRLVSQDGTPEIELFGIIKANDYFLLERSDDDTVPDKLADQIYTGALGNSGEFLELIDNNGAIVDFVNMGEDWSAGDNVSKQTMSRVNNNWMNSLNPGGTAGELNDFAEEDNQTDDQAEIATSTSSTQTEEDEQTSSSSGSEPVKQSKKTSKPNIIISEIFPNVIGSDEKFEFIELYNAGEDIVDLHEWQIGDESKKRFRFKESRDIGVGEFLVLYREETGIAMNNNGDTISLYKKDRKTAVSKIKYKKAFENMSLNCLVDREILGKLANVDCEWSEEITAGKKNQIKLKNRAPLPDFSVGDFLLARTPIMFDASDTVDPDGNELEYFWDFGDGFSGFLSMPDHTFAEAGEYKVVLGVSDGEFKEEISRLINIMDWKMDLEMIEAGEELKIDWKGIVISEVLPNPEGLDTDEEYVEIINTGKSKINLLDWQLDDVEGGSKPYTFVESIFLESGAKFLLSREDSGLAFNNNKDEVRLIAPDKSIIDLAVYEKAKEGAVYARDANDKWNWSTEIVNKNEIIENKTSKIKISKITQTKIRQEVSLEDIAEIKLGSLLKVRGKVAVEPGILGSQYFYIVGSAGIQIYNYKKDFPDLLVGDLLSVEGELTSTKGELRIKTKSMADMRVIEHGEAPKPYDSTCEAIEDAQTGSLFKITGEVVEKKGSSVFLDDGTAEVLVYIKQATGINLDNIKKGDELKVVGILSNTASGKRIMPRSSEDISFLNIKDYNYEEAGQVLGEELDGDEWVLETRDKNKEKFIYFFMILGAGAVVVIGWFLKYKLKKK